MPWSSIPAARTGRRHRRHTNLACQVEILEPRTLLVAGITAHGVGTIMAMPGVPLSNVTVATFTVDDPSSVPGLQRLAHIEWGDGQIDKRIVPVALGGNLFAIRGTHTYSSTGNFTIVVKISVPMMPTTINTVTDQAVVANAPPPTPVRRHVESDIDGNGQSDLVVFNPATAVWSIRLTNPSGTALAVPFGSPGEIPLVGDIDGNGQADLVLYDPNTALWSIRLTNNAGTVLHASFGPTHGIPLLGDFDGNGQDDLAVFNPTTAQWSIRLTSNGATFQLPFGSPGDTPLVGDIDGNGQSDLVVFHPSTALWSVRLTNNVGTVLTVPFGSPTSMPLIGDLDGNGQDDLIMFDAATATWKIRLTNNAGTVLGAFFGTANATPQLLDADGNGQTDLATFQSSTAQWAIRLTSNGATFHLPFGPTNSTPALPSTYQSVPSGHTFRSAVLIASAPASDPPPCLFVPLVTENTKPAHTLLSSALDQSSSDLR